MNPKWPGSDESVTRPEARHVAAVQPPVPLLQIAHQRHQAGASGVLSVNDARCVDVGRRAFLAGHVDVGQLPMARQGEEGQSKHVGVRGQEASGARYFRNGMKSSEWSSR